MEATRRFDSLLVVVAVGQETIKVISFESAVASGTYAVAWQDRGVGPVANGVWVDAQQPCRLGGCQELWLCVQSEYACQGDFSYTNLTLATSSTSLHHPKVTLRASNGPA